MDLTLDLHVSSAHPGKSIRRACLPAQPGIDFLVILAFVRKKTLSQQSIQVRKLIADLVFREVLDARACMTYLVHNIHQGTMLGFELQELRMLQTCCFPPAAHGIA